MGYRFNAQIKIQHIFRVCLSKRESPWLGSAFQGVEFPEFTVKTEVYIKDQFKKSIDSDLFSSH